MVVRIFFLITEAIRIREMITTLPLPLHIGTIEWKMKHLYDACMEVDIVNADQARPLANIISQLGEFIAFTQKLVLLSLTHTT